MENKKGFTLLELLVVVLIIGILASIALPQYQMAVTKSRVASMLPLMRRWKDALMEYKLQHGSYIQENGERPSADILGVNWPNDWGCDDLGNLGCGNDYWYCYANEEGNGQIYCDHTISDTSAFSINMYQADDILYEDFRGMMTCSGYGTEVHKICKALGGTLVNDYDNVYQL